MSIGCARIAVGNPEAIPPDAIGHCIGGGRAENLRLKARERELNPPGISLLLGGTPRDAAEQMRQAFPDPQKFARVRQQAETVGSTSVAAIRAAGFEVVPDPSAKFPNHARLMHPAGVAGFSDENLQALAGLFQDTSTPEVES
jgi:hypothetical protein